MKNLHLKNLTNIPTEYVILKKLYNLKKKNTKIIPPDLISEIITYIETTNFKNKNIKYFIKNFSKLLTINPYTVNNYLDEIIKIITLLNTYKLNHLDINSQLDFEKINNHIININDLKNIKLTYSTKYSKTIMTITYKHYHYKQSPLNINKLIILGSNNKITHIMYHQL